MKHTKNIFCIVGTALSIVVLTMLSFIPIDILAQDDTAAPTSSTDSPAPTPSSAPTPSTASAGDFQRVRFTVGQSVQGKVNYSTVQYAVFKSYRLAQNAKAELKTAITADEQAISGAADALETTMRKMKTTWKTSTPNGIFSFTAMPGMGVVVMVDNVEVEAYQITAGKTEYSETVTMKRMLSGVTKIGQYQNKQPTMKKVPGMDNGFEVSFNVNLALPKGFTTDYSRLIIQPMAIDCQTEDTIDFITPIVFEADDYHRLQHRRMDFDYTKNDPLAVGYTNAVVLGTDREFTYDTTVVYRKPDKDKIYKGAYTCVLEDYNHVIWQAGEGTGSCLAFRPFKFLNFAVAAAQLPLSSEFQQTPDENFQTIPRNLKLKFEVGKDVLSDDSLNQVELDKLVKELKSYGERLMQVKISGSASPEGSLQKNQQLAERRATAALSLIRRFLPRDTHVGTEPAKVYTWQDVLTAVEAEGDSTRTAMVGNIIKGNDEANVYAQIKQLPFYESTIVPILENQRIMKCSYIYETQHIMDPEEARAAYYENKQKLLKGEKDFSDGDYFNLFATVTDSLELDTITMLAYQHTIKQPGFVNLKFSSYAANRMALLNIRRGTPDPSVLAPFIDYSYKKINLRRRIDDYNSRIINRSELLVNQAITYFQQQKLDTAAYILEWMPRNETTYKLRQFVTFSQSYIPYVQGTLDPAKRQQVEEAERFVYEVNPDNRAIIYTELHNHLGVSREVCEGLLDKMPDSSAKKWYLKGILASEDAGKKSSFDDDPFGDAPMGGGGGSKATPDFLAYFQHSFDLEPKYRRMYANEGNVSDDVRELHPYKVTDITKYRKHFETLVKAKNNDNANDNAIDNNDNSNDNPTTTPDE